MSMDTESEANIPGEPARTGNALRYREEIARRTPPKNDHDLFMLEVFRQLLESESKKK